MSTDPVPDPPAEDPATQPSTNPSGPQPRPTPPEPQPGGDPRADAGSLPPEIRASNPNSGGPLGLSGGRGVSSERTGPAGHDHRGSEISGTGSVGGAVSRTDGGVDTSPTAWDAVDVSQDQMYPDRDADLADTSGSSGRFRGHIDRTVGEPQPEPVTAEKNRR